MVDFKLYVLLFGLDPELRNIENPVREFPEVKPSISRVAQCDKVCHSHKKQ